MESEARLVKIQAAGARLGGVGKTKVYELIAAGEIEAVSIGRSRRVIVESIDAYIERLRKAACTS